MPNHGRPDWPDLLRARRAIVVVDIVESVRLMQADEDGVIARWRRLVHLVRSEGLPRHGGRLVKSLGDGMLLEFEQTPRAAAMAFELLRCGAALNEGLDEPRRMRLRVGLHVAEVVADDLDVYGSGVNLAARIAGAALPDGIAASAEAVDELLPGVDAQLQDAGLCYFKHLDEPVQVFHLLPVSEGPPAPAPALPGPRPTVPASGPGEPAPAAAACVALIPVAAHPDHRTLGELLSDLLVTRLSTVPSLRVISRLSTEQYRLRGFEAEGIARHCGAQYLVSGRLHGRAPQGLLFVELSHAATQEVLWADSVRIDTDELLDGDEGVTPGIVQSIVDRIVAHQVRRVHVAPLPNLDSQTLQFSAIHLMHRHGLADFARAHELLEHLIERHPRASAPHAWLARWHVLGVTKGWAEVEPRGADRAMSHTHRALDLNPDSAMAIAMEAFVLCHIRCDLAAARRRLKDALALDPNEPWAWLVRSTVDSLLGDGQDAWQSALRARELSPMDPLKHYYDGLAASAAVAAERYADARQLALLSLSKDGRHLPTLRALAIAPVHLGAMVAARSTASTLLSLQPDFSIARYLAGSPAGAEPVRRRWAEALREAGIPEH